MKYPIILNDNGDVNFFFSKDELERYIEAEDIHIYEAFDAEGYELSFSIRKIKKRFIFLIYEIDSVEVKYSNPLVKKEKYLLSLLLNLCNKYNLPFDDAGECKLIDILNKLIKHQGYTH